MENSILEQAASLTQTYNAGLLAAKEYGQTLAKFTAIRFLEWCAGEGWQPYDSNECFLRIEDRKIATSSDLYDMFEHRNDWKTRNQTIPASVADVKIQEGLS